MEKISAHFDRMSRREQNLAVAVAGLLLLMVCVAILRGAYGYVQQLDADVDRLQEDIVNYKHQIARRQEVDALYARVAKQHSSAWSEAEIHDRLRQEIYRLAQMSPPPLDDNGIPVQISTSGGALVDIPTLRQGVLLDGGADYREYRLDFRIEKGAFQNVVAFIERLQNSPQSLRIDDLVISRPPTGGEVGARMEITRTVVNGAQEEVSEEAKAIWTMGRESATLSPSAWKAQDCSLKSNDAFGFHDEAALEVQASAPGATVFFPRDVETGFSYDMYIEVAAFGACELAVADANGGGTFEAPYALNDNGQPHRYHVRFTVPGEVGGTTKLRTPALTFNSFDAKAIVSRLIIKKAMV